MKKIFIICACMLLMTACGHEHEYTSEITKEATCTEPGILTYTCVKGDDSYTEEIEAAHSTEVGVCEECDEFVELEYVYILLEEYVGEGLTCIRLGVEEIGKKDGNTYKNYVKATEYFKEAIGYLETGSELCGDFPYLETLKSCIGKQIAALPLQVSADDVDSFRKQYLDKVGANADLWKEDLKIWEEMKDRA